MKWLIEENERLYNSFLQRKAKEKQNIIGKTLCFVGLHKWYAYRYKSHKAEDCIMSQYFCCIRCGVDETGFILQWKIQQGVEP